MGINGKFLDSVGDTSSSLRSKEYSNVIFLTGCCHFSNVFSAIWQRPNIFVTDKKPVPKVLEKNMLANEK